MLLRQRCAPQVLVADDVAIIVDIILFANTTQVFFTIELFARDSGQPQKHNPVSRGEQYQSKYRAFRDDKADMLNYIVPLSQ